MKNVSITETKESSEIVEVGIQRRADDPNPVYPIDNQLWINSSKTSIDARMDSMEYSKGSRINTTSFFNVEGLQLI